MFERERCHWFHRVRVCDVLGVLQHECTEKCSFYETEEDYQKRQVEFREHENSEYRRLGLRKEGRMTNGK